MVALYQTLMQYLWNLIRDVFSLQLFSAFIFQSLLFFLSMNNYNYIAINYRPETWPEQRHTYIFDILWLTM